MTIGTLITTNCNDANIYALRETLLNSGTNIFTTLYNPIPATLMVYIEGILQDPTTYTLNENTITLLDTDIIPSNYIVSVAYEHILEG